jgi:hypothetical protein
VIASVAAPNAAAQLIGLYRTIPGTLAAYQYQADEIQTELLPVDLTVNFSGDGGQLSATIHRPIIGAHADGTPIFPIASSFPMRVTGSSTNDVRFHGDLLGTQYLFDWEVTSGAGTDLMSNGSVYWAGGRYEQTSIANARLVRSLIGDYNDDRRVDVADYVLWRNQVGSSNTLRNDLIGGKIGTAQYDQWKIHMGESIGSGSGPASGGSAVPEPGGAWLALLWAGVLRRRSYRHGA